LTFAAYVQEMRQQ